MKVAVASEGETEDSKVSQVSGQAPYYLIFEGGKLVKAIKNPFRLGGGAGFAVARMLVNEKVKQVVAGNFGGNMKMALDDGKVAAKVVTGKTVREAVDAETKKV
ncbi:MAG: NifB/NifX family molybdenum-iron cluster-binding protein [archaeon]